MTHTFLTQLLNRARLLDFITVIINNAIKIKLEGEVVSDWKLYSKDLIREMVTKREDEALQLDSWILRKMCGNDFLGIRLGIMIAGVDQKPIILQDGTGTLVKNHKQYHTTTLFWALAILGRPSTCSVFQYRYQRYYVVPLVGYHSGVAYPSTRHYWYNKQATPR